MSDTLSVINTRASAFDRPCVYQSAAAAAQHSSPPQRQKTLSRRGTKAVGERGRARASVPRRGRRSGAARRNASAGGEAAAGKGAASPARKGGTAPAEPTKRAGQSSAPTRPPTTAAQETRGDRGAPASPPAKNERAQTEASEDAPQRSLRPLVFGEGATCICFLSHHLRKRKGRASDLLCPCAF